MRYTFGETVADYVASSSNRPLTGKAIKFWSAKTGGTQYTDLLVNGVAATTATSGTGGRYLVQGPDGVSSMWADEGTDGDRVLVFGSEALVSAAAGGGGGGSATTSASDLTSGTLAAARIADGSLPIAKTTGLQAALDAKLAAAVASATYQPLDSDLTAIAALSTTAYGRALLALADAAAGRSALGLGTAATTAATAYDPAGSAAAAQAASQPVDSDLTAIAALTTTAFGRSFLDRADAAAGRTLLGLGTAATQASSAFEAAGTVATHEADTTSVHGITDTSRLLVYRGAWAASTAYAVNDIVTQDNAVWRRTVAGTSGTTFNSSLWEPLGEPYIGAHGDLITAGEETIERAQVGGGASAVGGSGVLRLTYFTARKSETVTQTKMRTNTTGAATVTLARIGLYEEDPTTKDLTLVAATPNDTTLFGAATSEYIRSFTASYAKVRGRRYALAPLVVATTAPNFQGIPYNASHVNVLATSPRITGAVSGLTDLPASILAASLTSSASLIYGEVMP